MKTAAYVFDVVNNTLTASAAFLKKASQLNTPEYAIVKQLRADNPGMAIPQLFQDCMEQFREKLVMEFETYLNGQKIHHDQLAAAIGDILDRSIGDAMKNVSIRI